MKRLASAFVALAVLAAPVAIAQGKLDCGKAYKGFWEKLEREVCQDHPRAACRREPSGAARPTTRARLATTRMPGLCSSVSTG